MLKNKRLFGEGGAADATVKLMILRLNSWEDPPRKPSKRKGEAKEVYVKLVSNREGIMSKLNLTREVYQDFVKGIHSPPLTDETGAGIKQFESKEG